MHIFCVLAGTCRSEANPLLSGKWEFYPLLYTLLCPENLEGGCQRAWMSTGV